MITVNPYLNFNGNCLEAFTFYKSVFGGEFTFIGTYADMPAEYQVPDSEKNKIMHISLPISDETSISGADTSAAFGGESKGICGFSLSINASTEQEAKRYFAALSEGGVVAMPLDKTFWGALFGMCIDKFGVSWMINHDYPINN